MRKSGEVMTEVRRLLAKELGSEEEEAMVLIRVAEQLKKGKRSWEEAEEEIRSSESAGASDDERRGRKRRVLR